AAARRSHARRTRRSDSARPGESCATILFLFESNSRAGLIQLSKPIMNNQQATDKAGSPRRLKIMKNDHTLYGILAGSEEKGRGVMKTGVYPRCFWGGAPAIFNLLDHRSTDRLVAFSPPAQPASIVSHAVQAAWETKS